jgi:hypothetical protein
MGAAGATVVFTGVQMLVGSLVGLMLLAANGRSRVGLSRLERDNSCELSDHE